MARTVGQLKKRIRQFEIAYIKDNNFRVLLGREEKVQAALKLVLQTWKTYQGKSQYVAQINEAYDLLITTLANAKPDVISALGATAVSIAVDNRLDILLYDLLEKGANSNSIFDKNITVKDNANLNIIRMLMNQQQNLPDNWDADPIAVPYVVRRRIDKKSWLLRAIDYNNRQGIEALFDFFINWSETWAYYRKKQIGDEQTILIPRRKAVLRAFLGLLIRLVLLPLTSTIYVLSRLAFLLGFGARPKDRIAPTRNPYKTEYMFNAIALIAGMVFELTIELINPGSLQTLAHGFGIVGTGMTSYVLGAVLMTAMIMITTAIFTHTTKLRAKIDNAKVLAPPSDQPELDVVTITSPKHYPIDDPAIPEEFKSLQRTVLYYHQAKKQPAIYEKTREQEAYKSVVTEFDNVCKAYSKAILKQQDMDYLITAAMDQKDIVGEQLASELQEFKVENKKIVKI